ncbi:NnrU family protein [uncultured Cohaesibacter sp.]|uniref:NnrU family protein n=1 Tax=uncultured Cohaesibacter sp. TaxID=1002546 RepID=UPI0029C968A4|nr:NnrU family protein [uncultured Cohaesibacter sp.]
MLIMFVGFVLFLAIHLVPQSPKLKASLTDKLGLMGYRMLHGVVALISIVLIFKGYFEARNEIILWYPPIWTRHLAATLMLFASVIGFAGAFSGKLKQWLTSPFSVAIKIWALAHLLANGSLADVFLFVFFLLFAVSYRISLKKRIRAGLVTVPEGKVRDDVIAVVLGLVLYVVMVFWLHEWLFDVAPLG